MEKDSFKLMNNSVYDETIKKISQCYIFIRIFKIKFIC